MKKTRKLLALFLCLCMTLIPMTVFAAEMEAGSPSDGYLLRSDATSDTAGKASAAVGDGLIDVSRITVNLIKFTFKDDTQRLMLNATAAQSTQTGGDLAFSYSFSYASGAIIETNSARYISCILTDNSGAVKYYGKLADNSAAVSGDTSDSLSIPLENVADGTYTLQVFSEEVNGRLFSDYASYPVTATVTVSGGIGTVSDFGGTVIHEHIWSAVWEGNETHHWHDCTAAGCPVTDDSEKDGYAEHSYTETVVDDTYKVSEATCTGVARYYKSCVCGAKGMETFEGGEAAGHRLTEYPYHAPTCTTPGNVEYWHCEVCNLNFADDQGAKELADTEIPAKHKAEKVEAKEPTATVPGNIEYWYCPQCEQYFEDADLTREITNEDTILPALGHTHTYGTEWKSDDSSHWHACTAEDGAKADTTAHTSDGGKVTTAATEKEKGVKTYSCTVCGRVLKTEEIPAVETVPDIPQTGDTTSTVLWIALLLVSAGGLTGAALAARKRKHSKS